MLDYLPLLNTVLVVVNLVIVIGGVFLAVRNFRLIRTWSYIERFNAPDLFEVKLGVELLISELQSLEPEAARVRAGQLYDSTKPADVRLRLQISTFLNIFTELGVAYKAGVADDKTAVLAFDRLVPHYWERLLPFIRVAQDRARPHTVFTSF